MKKLIRFMIILLIVIMAFVFIVRTLKKSAPPPQVSTPPSLPESPARIYGKIEPAGREVFVSASLSRMVTEIYVKEGDSIKKGHILLNLEDRVERAQVETALARVESLKNALKISQDTFERNRGRLDKNAVSEYEYQQSLLKFNLDAANVHVAEREAELARAQLALLKLESPIDGIVYKFDVRLGETLQAGDTSKIILGSPQLWVRLSVEAFWMDRVKEGMRCAIYDSETGEKIGEGVVIQKSPYVGRRNFRTEDFQERFDTKFQDVVLTLEKIKEGQKIPLGLSVVAILAPKNQGTYF